MIEEYFDLSREAEAYTDREQLEDYLQLLDLMLSILFYERRQEDCPEGVRRGLALDEAQMGSALLSGREERRQQWEYPLLKEAVSYICARETVSELGGSTRLLKLSAQFGLDFSGRFLLVLACAGDWDRKYEQLFALLQGDPEMTCVTEGLAETAKRLILENWGGDGILSEQTGKNRGLLYRQTEEPESASGLRKYLVPCRSAEQYLKGNDNLPSILCEFAVFRNHIRQKEAVLGDEYVDCLTRLCRVHQERDGSKGLIIQLKGRTGSGRKFLLEQACYRLNRNLLVADARILLGAGERDRKKFTNICKELASYALLHGSILCLDELEPEERQEELAGTLLRLLGTWMPLFFFTSDRREQRWPGLKREIYLFELPQADFHARYAYWELFLGNLPRDKTVDLVQAANVYQYNAGQIREVSRMAGYKAAQDGRSMINRKDIVASVRDYNSRRMGKRAHLIDLTFDWKDMVLDEYQKKRIMDACKQIQNRHMVQDKWKFGEKTPYGKGLGILLYGSPGVGKTMSVQIISRTLGLDAYRIDLSQMVSKYVGEKEKNLGEIFDMAKNSCSILFFDEADALFAKRTDVKDSKDRYANMETSYLLQKIEEHDGIVILASNNINNFDEAFQRRMQYIINIPMPGTDQRLRLWKTVFPAEAPLEDNIDFTFLANNFELTGSRIKSIAIQAAYYAADEGVPIGPVHILRALQTDMAKTRRMLSASELGPYEDLFERL